MHRASIREIWWERRLRSEAGPVLVLGGAAIVDPVVMAGPFIMNDERQVSEAIERYRRGEMGSLAPTPR